MIDLKPCPFCGFKPDFEDDDCCYPIAIDHHNAEYSLYGLHCYSTGGGCGAQVIASTPEECVTIWNTRIGEKNDS